MLHVMDNAPEFELMDAEGNAVSLRDFAGKKVVLYFYPKDDTPGCTIEAIQFTAARDRFAELNTVVLGISKDSCASHAKFASKHNLNVLLLSDPEHVVQDQYGVWQQKSMMGKKYMGTARTTFLIDGEGMVRHIWQKVDVAGHAEEVLKKVASL